MSTQKSILFFFCDQFLWNALGYAGHSLVKTPNLDRLAAKSVNFPHTYCASPVCAPARISLFTGQYPHTHGQLINDEIRPGTRMFIETLRQAGFHTGAVGKLHFVPLENKNRFDSVLLHDDMCDSDYLRHLEAIDPKLAEYEPHAYPRPGTGDTVFGNDILAGGEKIESINYGTSQLAAEHFYTQWMADESIKFLEAHRSDRFFLFVSFLGPHGPFLIPEPYDTMYDPDDVELPETWQEDLSGKPRSQLRHRHLWGVEPITEQQLRKISALYYGSITLIDEHIGRILDRLQELRLDENTIIAFSADHGELLGAHGLFYKGVMYDESLRVPLLIHDAGQTADSVSQGFVSQVDIMPTLLDLAGIDIPQWSQGRSMTGLLAGDESCGRPMIFAEIRRWETYYMLGCRTRDHLFSWEIHSQTFTDDGELYDLRADAAQCHNLFHDPAYAGLVREFRNRIVLWLAMDE